MSAFLVLSPSHVVNPWLPIAAIRAGETGILDLGFGRSVDRQRNALEELVRHAGKSDRWGIRWDLLGDRARDPVLLKELLFDIECPLLILAGLPGSGLPLAEVRERVRGLAGKVLLEVYSLGEAQAAEEAGFDGVIAKGHEASGRVSGESAFLLLQRLHNQLKIPFWTQGGIGPDTAAAPFVAGAAGIVLCEQLWLAEESPFAAGDRRRWSQLDGSETATIGDESLAFRVFTRTGREFFADLQRSIAAGEDWQARLRAHLAEEDGDPQHRLIGLGQEIAFAGRLADKHVNVAGILAAYKRQIEENINGAKRDKSLAPGAPLAEALGTRYPILQGPMTRVSDVADFCEAVAVHGAMPFLALSLMRAEETRKLLLETKERLGTRGWGVGILGFVPPELRNEQLAVIAEVKPRFAIIAGGRPSQAKEFENSGIHTFLHVPSPGLLEVFLRDGARKFIFEGRECGGHVGPRSSFVLWQSIIDVLANADLDKPDECQVVFAGGIHDALSAAMVAAIAAPLTARGMKIGVLMGTGYLFTHEAVQCGAITEEFQRQAIACEDTVLLESGIGHATRCVRTPFAEEFNRVKRELILAGKSSDEIRMELELLNIGRLRIASKGRDRTSDPTGKTKSELVEVDVQTQRKRGMYMIGQVAGLRGQALPMARFHEEVSADGAALLDKLTTRRLPWHKPADGGHRRKTDDIAVIGMACMFPKADDLRQYWQNIFGGVDAIEQVPAERWNADDYFSEDRFAPDRIYSKWGGFLGKVVFDPMKWRIPPAALKSIEPIQLLSLEVAARAMEDAGYHRRDFPRERTGVIFAAAGSHEIGGGYNFRTMMRHYLPMVEGKSPEEIEQIYASLEEQLPEWTEDSFPGFLLNVIAGRIAREFNLNGPNYVVDAACAASLAALHAAIEQLRQHTSDMMLVGAADATNNPFCYMCFSKTHALSPGGRSRPFDDSADGISLGEGIAVLVLKRAVDAERDGDRIYAVIRGIGGSSDGKNRSLTAPHPPGQAKAVVRAYEDAQVSPATVALIEAHGTGTAVGDSAELTTLSQVYNEYTERKQFVAVGSVKSMIGHTKTVAGMASLIKAILAIKHGVLPPTLGVTKPTERIDFSASPFYLNTETRPWLDELGGEPRRAGVSAFGFGGTNFHVVLEEYTGNFHPSGDVDLSPRSVEVLAWRRASRGEIVSAIEQLEMRLADVAMVDLAGLAQAVLIDEANRPSKAETCRLSIVAASLDEVRQKLLRARTLLASSQEAINDPTGIYYSHVPAVEPREVCFLYPGQGSQSVNMLRDLVATCRWSHPLFARANSLLSDFLPEPITRYIYPTPVFSEEARQQQFKELSETRVAQPALGILELFATELLDRFGIRPGLVAGHSYGELVALHVAGCLTERELLWLSAMRGKVCSEVAHSMPGGMAAVRADAKTTLTAIRELGLDLHLANMNAPDQTVIGGSESAIEQAVEQISKKGLKISRLPVSAAFHTPLLGGGSDAMAVHFGMANFQPPRLPVYSNTTGEVHGDNPLVIRDLLTQHFSEPVQFEKEIRQMYADGARLFIEVGPGKVLTSLVGRILSGEKFTALALDAPGRDGWTQFGHLLAQAIALGLPVTMDPWFQGRGLAPLGLAEFLEAAVQKSKPKPSDWIVGPCKAEPVTPLPRRKRESGPSALRAKFGQKSSSETLPSTQPVQPQASAPSSGASFQTTPQGLEVSASATQNREFPSSTATAVGQAPWGAALPGVATPTQVPQQASFEGQAVRSVASVDQPVGTTRSPLIRQRTTTSMNQPYGDPAVNGQTAAHAGVEMYAQFQETTRHLLDFQQAQQRMLERFLEFQERMLTHCLGSPAAGMAMPAAANPAVRAISPQPIPAPQAAPPLPTPTPVLAQRVPPVAVARPPIVVPNVAATPASPPPSAPPCSAPTTNASPEAYTQNGHEAVKVAPAPAAVSGNAGEPPSTEEFRRDLLEIVSERTGYPVDMLDETLPLEAGLGIDSIKTVEIFSNLKKYHEYFADEDQDEEERLVEFTKLKTLRDIIDSYDRRRQAIVAGQSPKPAESKAASGPVESLNGNHKSNGQVERFTLTASEAPLEAAGEKKNSLSGT